MMYYIVHYIHVLAAVTSLGVALIFPIMSRTAKTATEAKQTIELFQKLKYVPCGGSFILILTSAVLLMLEPKLLTQTWFVLSLLFYLLLQGYTAIRLPKILKQRELILEAHTDEELPVQYYDVLYKTRVQELVSQLLVLLLIFLLVFKPW